MMTKMERSRVNQLKAKEGQHVLVQGWVHELRDQSKIKFILVRDISGVVQCVVKNKELFNKFAELTPESVVSIEGEVKKANVKSEEVTQKEIEIETHSLEILSKAEALPIQVVERGIPTNQALRLDNRFLDLRKPKIAAIFKVRSALSMGLREFLFANGFIEMHTPKIVGSGAEGGATLFALEYFGKQAYLSQSQQLYKQMMNIAGYDRVFEIGPSFRAEKSHTIRHLTEFTQLDLEFSFINDEDDIFKLQERMLVFLIEHTNKNCKTELEMLGVKNEAPKIPFPRITYDDGLKLLKEEGVNAKEIGQEEERLLGEIVKKKHHTEAFFITKMPKKDVKFYAMVDGEYSRYGDLEYKNNELSSGGQREHRYEILVKQIKEQGLNPKDFDYYTTPFKYGAPPHGGFGLGIDRLTQFILNLPNIRESVLFPRDTERLMP